MKQLIVFTLLTATGLTAAQQEAVLPHKAPLMPNAFYPLPLGAVRPTGWLRDQLRIQADGLSGHLEEFWPDLGPGSAWLGGGGEGWERGPYYLDGLVPLAYLLGDPVLVARARKWVDWALDHQRSEGAIGPEKNLDWWPNMLMLKALTQYQEATGDPRVIPFFEKYVAYQLSNIDKRPLHEWAVFRWQDEVVSLIWLYDRTGSQAALELAGKLHKQGYDWDAQFANFGYTEKVSKPNLSLKTHGVNNAMALKAAAVWYVITGDEKERKAAYQMLAELDRYHLQANGMHSADEHYAGRDPSQGVELCAVVEAMFSYETELAILGDAAIGDRLEKVAFNALPGTFSPDMWAHQYDQQPNQVLVSLANRNWASNGPESNLFGLQPNFGCCTANMHQGWPKFAASIWMATSGMATSERGLAAIAYGPSEVTATVADGAKAHLTEQTEYPFRGQVTISIALDRDASFPLALRIPGWAAKARVSVNGSDSGGVQAGRFFTIARTWKSGDTVELVFPMEIRVTRDYHNAAVIERGPLVYSLAIGETWRKLKQTGPAPDWEIFPTTPWNYALSLDLSAPERSFTVKQQKVPKQPFSFEGAPVILQGRARR
ncbi:MAG: glycoside hydrolase family 127 protein, partial [Acidobacteriota bacterium]|nr:glycoside hydrolase family 127 protein [Acidobacteriota bacterium]